MAGCESVQKCEYEQEYDCSCNLHAMEESMRGGMLDLNCSWDGSDINNESNVKDPEVGMNFPSWDVVDSYCHAYGKQMGFGVVRAAVSCKQKPGRSTREKRAGIWRCDCWGKSDKRRVYKGKRVVVQSPIQKSPTNKTNSSKKCECPAMVYAKPNKCNEWELCTVVLKHKNHTPTPSKSRHILKYRNEELNKCNVARNLFNANAAGVSITKIHRTLVMERNGLENLGVSERDVRNVIDKKRRLKMQGGCLLNYQQLNVNCRVEQFARIMEELDEPRLRVVEEMDFGTLKFVKGHSLNKGLAYWLVSRVNPETGVLIGGDRQEFPLSPVQVQCVLGIPRGKQVVPIEVDPENVDHLMRFNDILEWFGKDHCIKGFISIPEAKQEVLREGQLVDIAKFRVAFLVVVLGMLVCPTTNFSTLASDVVPALCAVDQPHDYDWCSYVLQFLMRRARSFSKNPHKDGYVVGCDGCTFFLSIFYVDHLKRPPMCWGEFPRIKAWSKDSFSKVAKDDMRTTEDYGKTKADLTITILFIKNLMLVVANRIGEVLSKEIRDLKGRREESFVVRTLGRGTMIDPSTTTARAKSSNIGRPPSFAFVPPSQPIFETTFVGLSSSTPLPSIAATAPTSSSSQAALANVPSTSTQAANESVRCAPIKVFRSKKTGKCVRKHLDEDGSSVQKNILDFVRRWSSKKRTAADDPVLIMCNGVTVIQSSCYGALSPLGTVDASFANMVGYNTFTNGKVTREAWLKKFAIEATYDGASLTMLFVPFVLQQHWTCIRFALKDKSIWVIDSMYSDTLTQHESPIANVIDSMDVFLSEICRGSPWERGQIQQWAKHSVHVDKQKNM
ncbi:Protein MAINTENANCE OF MERISTEMS [Bienertia sinuspersici]